MNAPIVIFDRIREEMKTKKRTEELDTLVNRCITSTFNKKYLYFSDNICDGSSIIIDGSKFD